MESLTLKSRKLEEDFKKPFQGLFDLYNTAGTRHYHALPSNLTVIYKFGVSLRVFGDKSVQNCLWGTIFMVPIFVVLLES